MVKPTIDDLLQQRIQKRSRTQKTNSTTSWYILTNAGFKRYYLIEELGGKTIAFEGSTFHYLFLMYKIRSLTEMQHGFVVVPGSDEVRFYGNVKGRLRFLSRPASNLELYIPKYYMSHDKRYLTFNGNDFIDAKKTDNEFAIGWKYPPKQYLSEEQIRQQEPEVSARIDARLAECRMDMSGLVEQLRAAACQHGIEVEVEYRTKTFASCYAWVQRMDIRTPELLRDINGIRLLPKTADDCYALLYVAHQVVEFDDIRDFILFPKSNCFQGLICMAKDKDLSLEVQIQTPRMKQIAETVAGNYRDGYST